MSVSCEFFYFNNEQVSLKFFNYKFFFNELIDVQMKLHSPHGTTLRSTESSTKLYSEESFRMATP